MWKAGAKGLKHLLSRFGTFTFGTTFLGFEKKKIFFWKVSSSDTFEPKIYLTVSLS